MSKTIESSLSIRASANNVWEILLKNSDYPKWNPLIPKVEGAFTEGEYVQVTLDPPGLWTYNYRPLILKATFPELRWWGKIFFKGFLDGEHYFRIVPETENSVLFVQGETFSGLMTWILCGTVAKNIEKGFKNMNEALKKRAESEDT